MTQQENGFTRTCNPDQEINKNKDQVGVNQEAASEFTYQQYAERKASAIAVPPTSVYATPPYNPYPQGFLGFNNVQHSNYDFLSSFLLANNKHLMEAYLQLSGIFTPTMAQYPFPFHTYVKWGEVMGEICNSIKQLWKIDILPLMKPDFKTVSPHQLNSVQVGLGNVYPTMNIHNPISGNNNDVGRFRATCELFCKFLQVNPSPELRDILHILQAVIEVTEGGALILYHPLRPISKEIYESMEKLRKIAGNRDKANPITMEVAQFIYRFSCILDANKWMSSKPRKVSVIDSHAWESIFAWSKMEDDSELLSIIAQSTAMMIPRSVNLGLSQDGDTYVLSV